MIYAIACEETHRIKIGYTSGRSAYKRLKSMQTGSPTRLTIVAEYDEGTRKQENDLHNALSDLGMWLHGEWFVDDPVVWDLARILEGYEPQTLGALGIAQDVFPNDLLIPRVLTYSPRDLVREIHNHPLKNLRELASLTGASPADIRTARAKAKWLQRENENRMFDLASSGGLPATVADEDAGQNRVEVSA
jgi:hypothetical protein